MNCTKPFVRSVGQAYGCGQCLPCRIKLRRTWTHRYMLEAAQYSDNAFVSLTYDNEHLPAGETLVPQHTQLWLKRLRKSFALTTQSTLRFALVGEYGDTTQRPHYHALLFGFPTCSRGRTLRRHGSERPLWQHCCPQCKMVGDTWTHGDVDLGNLETSSAQYVAKYTTKKMTAPDDPRLFGRHPEFSRRSNRPGIGASALHEIASQLMTFNLVTPEGDVPSSLRHGTRLLPLGRYLRRKLRTLVGKDEKAPAEELAKMAASVHLMLENYERTSLVPGRAQENLTQRITDASSQKARQIIGRHNLFKKPGAL